MFSGALAAAEPDPSELAPFAPAEPPPPEAPPPTTRAERKALRRAERDRAADRARELERFRQRWEAKGGDPLTRPPLITCEMWGNARAVIHSPAAARAALQWLARKHGGAVAARIMDAAFGGGRWDLSELAARRFIALAVFFYEYARLTPWSRTRDGRLQLGLCARGVTRQALCALLADPHASEPLSLSALSSWSERWSGYLVRGEECLVWERVQVPAQVAEPWEVGPSGYAANRYWLCSSTTNKPSLDMSHVLDAAREHERGWQQAFGLALTRKPANDAPPPPSTAPPP